MNINKEIIVYVNRPYKKYRWLGIMSAVQIGFVVVNFVLMPTPKLIQDRANALKNRVKKKEPVDRVEMILEEYELNPDYDSATIIERMKRLSYREMFSPRNILDNLVERPIFSAGALGSAFLISFGIFAYCRRMAHTIILLPNERVRFTSFTPLGLGKPHSIELPLQDVSCVTGRKANMNYCVLKFKGYFGYHLIQKQDGQFLEPKLFDHHLGYARTWAART